MKSVSFWGLRGGSGTTSTVAMVGEALHALGESVLMVDVNPSDVLRLHFNVDYGGQNGWALALAQATPWQDEGFVLEENMWLLPYGRHGLNSIEALATPLDQSDEFWCEALRRLDGQFSWVLFDLPAGGSAYPKLRATSGLDIMVTSVDTGCHILLLQHEIAATTRILINAYDPSRALCNDLLLEWRHRYQAHLLPVYIHRDEGVHEALAQKTPVSRCYPDCAASRDALSLATWLLAQKKAAS
ncbi:cellulose biosynthesis protein BcsQ [Pollutimonas subterranea]|uniref:cellulose biosynthesis protein BcsQ n=1 Tax=Pollutimonas subterranea TaxID=2045210 RepID=UPI00130416CB|nr:cellulose biosynthesis protein BcsQ [Pollutimonas subterranea]